MIENNTSNNIVKDVIFIDGLVKKEIPYNQKMFNFKWDSSFENYGVYLETEDKTMLDKVA